MILGQENVLDRGCVKLLPLASLRRLADHFEQRLPRESLTLKDSIFEDFCVDLFGLEDLPTTAVIQALRIRRDGLRLLLLETDSICQLHKLLLHSTLTSLVVLCYLVEEVLTLTDRLAMEFSTCGAECVLDMLRLKL